MGLLAAEEPRSCFHIISKDKGFDPLIQHLKARKIPCFRWEDLASLPFLKIAAVKSPQERAQFVIEKLQQPKATKPRTEKTLGSAVASLFQKQLSADEVAAVLTAMQGSGFITVTDGKIAYPVQTPVPEPAPAGQQAALTDYIVT